jgi:hypothetical protein
MPCAPRQLRLVPQHKLAALQPAARGKRREAGSQLRGQAQRRGSPVLRIEVSSTSLRTELSMSDTRTVSPLRQRMIEDMAARKGLVARIGHLAARSGRYKSAGPFLTPDSRRAI